MEDGHEPILRWGFSVGVYSSAQSASAQRSTCVSMIRLSDDWDNPILLWYRRGIQHFFRLLSRDCQSSEQFAGLNRRYDEMQAEFALVPLTISETSQEEELC